MIRYISWLLLPLLLTARIACAQDAGDPAANLIRQAEHLRLADHRYWRALLHYRPLLANATTKSRSGIVSADFFLASDGAENPDAELAATLRAFFAAPGDDPGRHAQCRFVARYRWLRRNLDWSGTTPPAVSCDAFREWSIDGRVESISLIFATGYLSNPASLYGHLLLKFNTPAPIAADALLDPSLSYGALVPPHENGAVYLYKGLLGGYGAGFSHEKFFRHNHDYAERELRDLWEYRLALTSDETAQIVAHSWELLHVEFHYYFFSENCASAVAELLQLVVDQPLLPRTPWKIPSTVFDEIATLQRDGVPLVAEVRRIPSRQNRFYAKYFALSTPERAVVDDFVRTAQHFDTETYRQLSPAAQTRAVDTLLDYYQFLAAAALDTDMQRGRLIRQRLLAERLRLPSGASRWPPPTQPPPPHESQPPFMLQAGAVANDSRGPGTELRVRPAYYDFLAPDSGRVPYSALAMFDLRVRVEQERLRFRSFDLVEVETLNLSRTGLPGDGGYAWKIKLGFEQENLRCISCTVFAIDGGVGRAHPLGANAALYALLEGRVQSAADDAGHLAAGLRLGTAAQPAGIWRTRLDIGARTYADGPRSTRPLLRWENRFGTSRAWDIRLNYEFNLTHEATAALSLYW